MKTAWKKQRKSLKKQGKRAETKQNFRVMTNSQNKALQNYKNVRNDLSKNVHTIIPTSCFVELMDSKQRNCKQLLESAVPTLNDLAKSFKDSCETELDLAMLNHVFILIHCFYQMIKLKEYKKILKHSQIVKNGSVKGVVD